MHTAISAKLRPPQHPTAEIPRTALCGRILAAAGARLVLLRAPAGFGKTTAMLQVRDHLRQAGRPTAWLTLDRADNDLVRFLTSLAAALGPLVPGLPDPAQLEAGVHLISVSKVTVRIASNGAALGR